jgi:2-desacetyl-2-hydroxyethyl bacteriochlorophyllide A dehydrogenase
MPPERTKKIDISLLPQAKKLCSRANLVAWKKEMKTKALWFAGSRRAELREEAVPLPGPRQARVRTLASAISHGSEMLVYRGQVTPDLALDLPTLAGSFAFPIKFGYACAGTVIDVGADVDSVARGDLVFALHPHQQVFTITAGMLLRLPPETDPLAAVFCANLETALNIVHDAVPRLGETVLVFGQGVVGLLVTSLLDRCGVRVVAVDPLEQRRRLALRMGAAAAVAPEDLSIGLGPRPADIAIEVSGAPAALQTAIDHLAVEGTVVVASWYGSKAVSLDLGGAFHRKRLRLRSSQVGRINPILAPRWDYTRRWETVRDLLAQIDPTVLISQRFAFNEAAAAYRLLDENSAAVVQGVFEY